MKKYLFLFYFIFIFRAQTHIFSPFRIYLDVRAPENRNLFGSGSGSYGKMRVYVHDYHTPYEIYKGKTNNVVLMRPFSLDPGVLHHVSMAHHEVRISYLIS